VHLPWLQLTQHRLQRYVARKRTLRVGALDRQDALSSAGPRLYQYTGGRRSTSPPSHLLSSPHPFQLHCDAAGANSPTARGPVPRGPIASFWGGWAAPHAPGVRHRAGSLDITARAGGGGSAPDGSAARARGVRLSERAPRRCCRQVWADLGRLRLCPGWCRRLGVGLEDPMEDVADLVLPDGLGQDEDRALRPAMQLGQIVGGGRDGG
jgi:hypothetical protein